MALKEKILQHFEGKIVRKDLTKIIKGNAVVPTYVLEYLLGQYCATQDENLIHEGIEKVKAIIRDHFVYRDEAELVKSNIRAKGSYRIIDKVSAVLNDKEDLHEAAFTNLGIKKIPVSDSIINANPKLLSGQVWCIINLSYLFSEESAGMPWKIESLKPIQISKVELEEYQKERSNFTREEWIDLILQSTGLEPSNFTFRGKLIQLARLIPHCENNYNYIELGPKGTGKSHVFSELSPHGVLVSGGDVSKANLFVNNTGNKIGLVGYWDVVAFDEFEQNENKKVDGDLVTIMQNFMANKSFNRGKDTFGSTASLAFVGNTKHSVPYMLTNSTLFDSIPKGFMKSAFFDRLHLYVPGWEVNVLKDKVFTSDYGLIVDYLAEILKELRKHDFSLLYKDVITLDESVTTRDREAISKTFSGLVKIIHPDGEMTKKEMLDLMNFALEGRKRIKDQIMKIDSASFQPTNFKYTDKDTGEVHEIETLEMEIYKQIGESKEDETKLTKTSVATTLIELRPKQIGLRDNQTGISFEMMFAAYLKGATIITLTDPYIRLPYQMRNLLEFCSMLIKIKEANEEINLKIITWNEPDSMIQESQISLDEMADSIFDSGISLTYEFNPNIHDRSIVANNGWKILLGRGLDIFQKVEGRLNIADLNQEKRQCKDCEITFIRNN
ncbi:MAG: BREX system Lon protease-like protein BrxL [Cyclobacteriaceae bacterium]